MTQAPPSQGSAPLIIHNPGTVLIGIIITAILFQIILLFWKRRSPSSYSITSLALLWLIPLLISVRNYFWRFASVWTVYTGLNMYLTRKVFANSLEPTIPRFIYRFYQSVFRITSVISGIGYFIFLANMLAFPSATLIDIAVTMMFYGLYFGVLSRDLIDFAAEKMATTIGYYKRDGFPLKQLRSGTCAICGAQVDMTNESEQLSLPEEAHQLVSNSVSKEKSLHLNCGHWFHAGCLHGWCLIGKKDICPYCKERVDLSVFHINPWKNPELIYGKLLDVIRYLVVWNPLLFMILHVVINKLQT